MTEPEEHERVVELLRRARRPEAEITPEHLEENLRWLIQTALPEAMASDALRRRVRDLADARRARPPSLRARLPQALSSLPQRRLLGAAALLATCVLVSLVVTTRARAQMLARTLAAMALVRSAHCTGWHIDYRSQGGVDQRSPAPRAVAWWYKAPDWYRGEMQQDALRGDTASARLVIKGRHSVLIRLSRSGVEKWGDLSRQELTRYLSALDFFDPHGLLAVAQSRKAGQIVARDTSYHGRSVQLIEVTAQEPSTARACRERWVLYADPISDRVIRSEARFDYRDKNGAWTTLEEEVLDQFDYNIPVNESLFKIDSPTPSPPPPHS